jgi:hypothetical protein
VNELNNRFKNKCIDQLCWINQAKIKAWYKIQKLYFRPHGPNRKLEWLSTTDINNVLEQYQNIHNDFLFLGAVPYDFEELPILNIGDINFKELENENKYQLGLVINLDDHTKGGSHWVALYINLKKYQIYFFDSVGKPPGKKIKRFIKKITKYLYKKKYNKKLSLSLLKKGGNIEGINNLSKLDIKYNNIQHQFKNTECGVYSTNFIIRLLNGEQFNNIINNIIKDDKMNEFRKEIFININ